MELNVEYYFLDKNECQNIFQCNPETSKCVNTIGSFYCKCLPGYEVSSRGGCQGKII